MFLSVFEFKRFCKFASVGVLNTVLSFGIYFILMHFINYNVAYFIAFFAGVIASYFFNASIVFPSVLKWRSVFIFSAFYLIQYAFSAPLLILLVEIFDAGKVFSPLIVVVFMLPINYFIVRFIFTDKKTSRCIN
jgi:putative flippase GtrA